MSRVRGKDTGPEMRVRRAAHARGLRFRLHSAALPGRPDLVFPSRMVAVFVHGCFWHRHEGCRRSTNPKTRADFWRDKFAANVARDARTTLALQNLGWTVQVIWECETANQETLDTILDDLTAKPIVPPKST
ncbi:MAG: very short patch repair endonuclease [Sphingomonadales bacterium]|nr:very short patch repair endonuclease [Sphingomonadales bacterium]